MDIVQKRLSELKHVEGNTRIHSAKQIREYIRSLKMFGQIRPMIIDENNVVLAGNGLFQALREMGHETADCFVMPGLTAKEKKKLMLADNKIFQLGEDDTFAFEEILSDLNGDIDIPGYGTEILKNMTSDLRSIDNFLNTNGQDKKSYNKSIERKVQEIIICPKCGHEFSREKKTCRGKRKDLVDTKVARA